MKPNAHYSLQRLNGAAYLLPFGQGNAELRRGVQLDENGVFLWEALHRTGSKRELLERYLAFTGATADEAGEAEADLEHYLETLRLYGILVPDDVPRETRCMTLAIGKLCVNMYGKEEYLSGNFRPFALEGGMEDAVATQEVTVTEAAPRPFDGARVTVLNRELAICETAEGWVLSYPQFACIRQAELSRDGSQACFHVCRPASGEEADTLREDLFHAIRHTFLYFAQRHGYYAQHSASILYRDRAWLFSAPSGTGKSTQAELWRAAFGTPCLNGDLNLLSARDASGKEQPGRIFVHGLPWCGTSGITATGCTELGGVILLRQSPENWLEPLRADQKQLFVANRLISPAWTEAMLADNLAFAGTLTQAVPVWRYHCTKEPAAADFLRAEIDRALEDRDNQ